jgi:flagellar biosynthetic protein FliP
MRQRKSFLHNLRPHLPALGKLLLLTLFCLVAVPVVAQQLSLNLGEGGDASSSARIVQLIGLITVLSIAPGILVMVTSFTRIIVVLSFLRSALGVQQTPPNQVLISLALFLTFFIMAPTFTQAWNDGVQPYMNNDIEAVEAFDKSVAPFRTFMLAHTREKDLTLFMDMGKFDTANLKPEDTPIVALIPAFMISELRRAFEIGFLIFLPFLVIDMVVASILMAMGMMMLPPVVISLPFKIVFFVLIDGWHMLAGSLVASYGVGPPPTP